MAPNLARRRWAALYVLCGGMLMIILDATIVNVALPSIRADFHVSETSLAWVVNAYLIPFGGLLLLAGRAGDLIGRRRVFLNGLVLFTLASAACAAAQNEAMLVAARFVQGIGGALTSAVILGIVVTMFTDPRERAKAIGIYGSVASAGGALGLLAGGALTQAISWHWIFLVNVPIGVVACILARRLVIEDAGIGWNRGADLRSAALITGALVLGVFTVLGAQAHGWLSPRTVGGIAGAFLLLALFFRRQMRVQVPLMPLRVFRSREVIGANAVQSLLVTGMYGSFFLGALYMQGVLHYRPLGVGLAFLPASMTIALLSAGLSDRIVLRFGPRRTLIAGLLSVLAGLLMYARTPVHGTYVAHLLPIMLLMGVGAGCGFPSIMHLAMSGAGDDDSGLASGILNTSLQVGAALGLAVLTAASTARIAALRAGGAGRLAAATGGYHLAYAVAAGGIVIALLIATFVVAETSSRPASESEAGAVDSVSAISQSAA